MAVTSQLKPSRTIGELILQDWREAGLLKPSVIKPIEKRLVIKVRGQLKADDNTALRESLKTILG